MSLVFLNNKLLFSGGKLAMSLACCCTDNPPIPITCSSRGFIVPTYFNVTFPNVTNTVGCLTCTGKGGLRRLKIDNPTTGTFPCFAGSCCGWSWSLCKDGSYPPDCGFGNPTIHQLSIAVPTDGVTNIRVVVTLSTECGGAITWLASLPQQTDFTSFSGTIPYDGGTECDGVAGTNVSVSA